MTDWKKPASTMTDDELTEAHFEIVNDIVQFEAMDDDEKERCGSPGEWLFERLDEIETEQRRRARRSPQVTAAPEGE